MKKFCDLNWLLQEINTYETKYRVKMSSAYLNVAIRNTYLGGRPTNSDALMGLATQLGLLRQNSSEIIDVSTSGKHFRQIGAAGSYDLNADQKLFLAYLYLQTHVDISSTWFGLFKSSFLSNGTCEIDIKVLPKNLRQWTIEMIYLEVAYAENEILNLNPAFWWGMGRCKPKLTEEELKRRLERQHLAGELAEQIALEFERNRLEALGWRQEAQEVRLIAKQHVNAGYDLISFSMPGKIHNRFIEVKHFNKEGIFYWSVNEMEMARLLRDRYFLYLVVPGEVLSRIIIVKNPYERQNELDFQIEPVEYRVKTPYTLNQHLDEQNIVANVAYQKV